LRKLWRWGQTAPQAASSLSSVQPATSLLENAEKKAGETLTVREFVKIGIPLTPVNALVYWLFFQLL